MAKQETSKDKSESNRWKSITGNLSEEHMIPERLGFSMEEKRAFNLYLASVLLKHRFDENASQIKTPEFEAALKMPIISRLALFIIKMQNSVDSLSSDLASEGDQIQLTPDKRHNLKLIANLISTAYTYSESSMRGTGKNDKMVEQIVADMEKRHKQKLSP